MKRDALSKAYGILTSFPLLAFACHASRACPFHHPRQAASRRQPCGEERRRPGCGQVHDRFYEDEGLLAPLRQGRARIYTERERVRVKLILRGKRLGLSLSEIRELFDLYAVARNERPQLAKFVQMLSDRRTMLQQQREDIDAVLAEIAILERDCRRRLKSDEAAARTGKVPPRGG